MAIKVDFTGNTMETIRQSLGFISNLRKKHQQTDEDPVAKKAREEAEEDEIARKVERSNRRKSAI